MKTVGCLSLIIGEIIVMRSGAFIINLINNGWKWVKKREIINEGIEKMMKNIFPYEKLL